MADEKVKVSSLVTVAPKTTDKVLITTTDDSGQLQTRNALVSDIRNLAASLEDSEDKAINVKIANEIVKKVTDLASEVDTSFETVNQNFTNVNNAISKNRDNITTANENMTAHEEDTDLHVTAEKQQKWDGYDQSIKDVKEIADNNTTQLNNKANTDDVFIKSEVLNGTMEIGKYIDFHSDDNKNTDFNGRLSHDNALKRFVAEHDSGINNKILEQRDIVNNLSTTQEGFILDARQGKLLYDMFGKLKFDTMVVNPNGQNSIRYTALAPIDRSIPLVLAQNGDTNVWNGFVTGVTVLDDNNISIGLNEARSGNIRINIFYKIK